MLVIGLGHKARHGKDYAAKYMVQHAAKKGLYAKVFSLADALKAHCRVTYGMREKDGPLLQLVGTEIFRKYQPDIWVRVCMDTIAEQAPDVAIIPDVRFQNEVRAIQQAHGYVVKVTRTGADGSRWVSLDRDPHHASEIALDDWDGWDDVITAVSGNIAGLEADAQHVFDRLYDAYTRQEERS